MIPQAKEGRSATEFALLLTLQDLHALFCPPHLMEHVEPNENKCHSRQEQYPELIICDSVGEVCNECCYYNYESKQETADCGEDVFRMIIPETGEFGILDILFRSLLFQLIMGCAYVWNFITFWNKRGWIRTI